jgi:hypothetical protein
MLPFVADMPPQVQERIVCSISAAVEYKIPANIMLAVAEKEGGQPGQWALNNNGTYDIGPMQFNTRYLTDLAEHGISRDHVAVPGCYPYQLAAWRLGGCIIILRTIQVTFGRRPLITIRERPDIILPIALI